MVRADTYWNPILDGSNNGSSHWGWKQNSMVTVHDSTAAGGPRVAKRNPEFYVFSHCELRNGHSNLARSSAAASIRWFLLCDHHQRADCVAIVLLACCCRRSVCPAWCSASRSGRRLVRQCHCGAQPFRRDCHRGDEPTHDKPQVRLSRASEHAGKHASEHASEHADI
jgi:hypothetical protein